MANSKDEHDNFEEQCEDDAIERSIEDDAIEADMKRQESKLNKIINFIKGEKKDG